MLQTDRQTTDRRQATDGTAIAYSERKREFTFAKNRYISLPLLRLNPPTEGSPGTISVQFSVDVNK